MEKLIHQYLEQLYFPYYYNGNYGIYHNDDIFDDINLASATDLVKNFKTIYCIEYEEVKLFVYTWGVKIFPDIDLTEYWKEHDRWVTYWNDGNNKAGGYYSHVEGSGPRTDFSQVQLPQVRQIGASTIALNLVSVQSMSAPKVGLLYMDYQYGNKPKKQTIKQKLNGVLDKIKIFIRKMEKDIRKYLHITNYNTTFVTQEK